MRNHFPVKQKSHYSSSVVQMISETFVHVYAWIVMEWRLIRTSDVWERCSIWKRGVENVKGSWHLKRTAAKRNDVHEKLICCLQRKVITKVTSLPNHSTGRKSNKPIRSRENAFSCTCCFIYLKCFYRKEGRKEGVMDERTPDVHSLQYILISKGWVWSSGWT